MATASMRLIGDTQLAMRTATVSQRMAIPIRHTDTTMATPAPIRPSGTTMAIRHTAMTTAIGLPATMTNPGSSAWGSARITLWSERGTTGTARIFAGTTTAGAAPAGTAVVTN